MNKSWRAGPAIVFWVTVLFSLLAYQPATLYFFGDTWDILAAFSEQGIAEMWRPHNEHFIPIPKLFLYWQYSVFGMNPLPFQIVNIIIHSAAAALLYTLILRFANHQGAAMFGALTFSFTGTHWEVPMWEAAQQISLALLFVLASLLLFDSYIRDLRERWLFGTLLASIAATLSMGFGFMVLILMPCVAFASVGRGVRRFLPQISLLTCMVLLVYALPRALAPPGISALAASRTALLNLASPLDLAHWFFRAGWGGILIPNATILGLPLVVPVLAIVVCLSFRRISVKHLQVLPLPVVWIFLSYLLAALGRLQLGVDFATSSRYQYFPMAAVAFLLAWCAALALTVLPQKYGAGVALLQTLLTLALLVHAVRGYHWVRTTSPRFAWGQDAHRFIDTLRLVRSQQPPRSMLPVEPEISLPASTYPFRFPVRRAFSLFKGPQRIPESWTLTPESLLANPEVRQLNLLVGAEPVANPEKWSRLGPVQTRPSHTDRSLQITFPSSASAFGFDLKSCCGERLFTVFASARALAGQGDVALRLIFKRQSGEILHMVTSEPISTLQPAVYFVSGVSPAETTVVAIDFAPVRNLSTPSTIEIGDALLLNHPALVSADSLSP